MIHKLKQALWGLSCKLKALWHVSIGKGLVYRVHFDSKHPLWISSVDENCLVTGCEFTGEASSALGRFTRIPYD